MASQEYSADFRESRCAIAEIRAPTLVVSIHALRPDRLHRVPYPVERQRVTNPDGGRPTPVRDPNIELGVTTPDQDVLAHPYLPRPSTHVITR